MSGNWAALTWNLGDDGGSFTFSEEEVDIDSPTTQFRLDGHLIKNGMEECTFNAAQIIAATFSDSSSGVSVGAVTEEGTVVTKRSLLVEFYGIGLIYCPKVRLRIVGIDSNVNGLVNVKYSAKVFATSSIPGGWQYVAY